MFKYNSVLKIFIGKIINKDSLSERCTQELGFETLLGRLFHVYSNTWVLQLRTAVSNFFRRWKMEIIYDHKILNHRGQQCFDKCNRLQQIYYLFNVLNLLPFWTILIHTFSFPLFTVGKCLGAKLVKQNCFWKQQNSKTKALVMLLEEAYFTVQNYCLVNPIIFFQSDGI